MFNFPLIGERRSIPYIVNLVIWIIGNLIGILSLFFSVGDINFLICLRIFLITNGFWIIGNLLIKKYKIVGNLELSCDYIKIRKGNDNLNLNIFKIKQLNLKYNGVKGDTGGVYVGLLRIKDGSGNIISFEYGGKNYKFEFLVTKKHFLNSIIWILKSWRDQNIEFKIIDQYKRDITANVLSGHSQY
jgi:hypothetical protein